MNRLERLLKSPWLAGFILLVAYGMALHGVAKKSVTFDETVHLVGGYTIWLKDDQRMVPDNGSLPQRWAAVPSFWRSDRFPSTNQEAWSRSVLHTFADQFIFTSGNDADSLVFSGRAMMSLIILATGMVIYYWSRSLFGATGALVSVIAYAFCPTILAHAPLVASDSMATLFFTLSLWTLWRILHRVDAWTIAACSFSLAGLFLSKFSGVLIIPTGIGLLIVRLLNPEPLPVFGFPVRRTMAKVAVQGAVIIVLVLVVWLLIWAGYGFRYSAFSDGGGYVENSLFPGGWPFVLAKPGIVTSVITFLRDSELFPEAFLYGGAMVSRIVGARQSFLNGEFGLYGFKTFFPYAFSVKETIPYLVLLALAVGAFVWGLIAIRRNGSPRELWQALRGKLYVTAPMTLFIAVNLAVALPSTYNVGHRHLLPIYPSLMILVGATAAWFTMRTRWMGALVAAMLLWHAGESIAVSPNYLTYFNEFAGGSSQGYHHLVDSSLDWGQDLPGLKEWLQKKGLEEGRTPVYLIYFGTGSPSYYQIQATLLPGFLDRIPATLDLLKPLLPGVYAISATHYQGVYLTCYGPWTQMYEQVYHAQEPIVREILAAENNPTALQQLESRLTQQGLNSVLTEYPRLREARLCAWLRETNRKPDALINNTILIFNLSAEDLKAALNAPLKLHPPLTLRTN